MLSRRTPPGSHEEQLAMSADATDLKHVSIISQRPTTDQTYVYNRNGLWVPGNPASLTEQYTKPTGSFETFSRTTVNMSSARNAPGVRQGDAHSDRTAQGLRGEQRRSAVGNAAVAPTHWWKALCDNTYTTLRSTADKTTTAFGPNNTNFTVAWRRRSRRHTRARTASP